MIDTCRLDEFGDDGDAKEEFPLLVEELATVLKNRGWLLSLIVPPMDQTSRLYDVKRILLNVDFVILESFDFRRPNEKIVGHHAPLYAAVDRDPSSKYRNVVSVYKFQLLGGGGVDTGLTAKIYRFGQIPCLVPYGLQSYARHDELPFVSADSTKTIECNTRPTAE